MRIADKALCDPLNRELVVFLQNEKGTCLIEMKGVSLL